MIANLQLVPMKEQLCVYKTRRGAIKFYFIKYWWLFFETYGLLCDEKMSYRIKNDNVDTTELLQNHQGEWNSNRLPQDRVNHRLQVQVRRCLLLIVGRNKFLYLSILTETKDWSRFDTVSIHFDELWILIRILIKSQWMNQMRFYSRSSSLKLNSI